MSADHTYWLSQSSHAPDSGRGNPSVSPHEDFLSLQRLDEALAAAIVIRFAGRLMFGTISCFFRTATYSADLTECHIEVVVPRP
jgi:hypothetical protein